MTRPRRQARRRAAKTVTIGWAPVLAEIFDLPMRLGMTPPGSVVVAMSQDGRRSTWTGKFRTAEGLPARTVVRMRHLKDGSASWDGGAVKFTLRVGPEVCG